MALPKVAPVVYEMQIPGIDKKVKYRPFYAGEYKTLLEAKEFGDDSGFINTVSMILQDCLLGSIDVDELPMYTADYVFLMIRAKSCGELVDAEYKCNNEVEEASERVPCGFKFILPINLSDAYIKFPENFNEKSIIRLSDTVGFKLKSPTFSQFRSVNLNGKGIFDITEEYIFSCIDSVYDGDEILIPGKDFSLEEFKEWAKSFSHQNIDDVTQFFKSQPSLAMNVQITCPKCRHTNTVHLDGLDDFFA